jgi:hypothetical protein
VADIFGNGNFFYVLRIFFHSFLGLESILTLAIRFLTILLVIAHYKIIEGIDYWTQAVRANELSFLKLVIQWHFVFMILKVFDEKKLQ